MFSIDINDKTKYSLEIKEDYWLEYSETIEKIINWEIINKYKNKLPISLQNEITTKGYYKNISFSNKVDDNAINDFKTKINKMKNEWKLIKINPLGFINFNEIHNNDIINRIQIIHTIFSFLNNHNKILSPDILDNKKSNNTEREYDGEWFFLEQFFIERKSNKKDSIRIFHCARIEKSIEDSDIKEIKITIFPLFIDTKHQIIPFVVKDINKLRIWIKLMVKHNIKTISDLKWNLSDTRWLKHHHSDTNKIKQIYKYQDESEIYKFILVDEKLVDFIDWLFKNYKLINRMIFMFIILLIVALLILSLFISLILLNKFC